MIVVVEPQCLSVSHEKVNSGFIYGLRLAFPDERIRFYADKTHIEAIEAILLHDRIAITNIEYRTIEFDTSESIFAFLRYFLLLRKLLNGLAAESINKIFFLSFTPKILFLLKFIKKFPGYKNFRFTLVLHGDFENIDTKNNTSPTPVYSGETTTCFHERIRKFSINHAHVFLFKVSNYLFHRLRNLWTIELPRAIKKWFGSLFPTGKMMTLNWDPHHFRYIALAPYIINRAKEYINLDKVEIFSVVLPTVFAEPLPLPRNSHPKFAIFGWGNPGVLRQINIGLFERRIEEPYEIRIIGSDNTGTAEFPNVTYPVTGRRLTRAEMEFYVRDVDFILIMYERNRYRLSCSGSILEAISYMKPIIHLDNECINFFNKPTAAIGINCTTIEEMIDVIENVIRRFSLYRPRVEEFRRNILTLRRDVRIERFVPAIRSSFNWDNI